MKRKKSRDANIWDCWKRIHTRISHRLIPKCSYFIRRQAWSSVQELSPQACGSPFYFLTQKVDFVNDWKLVTIFVGTNDLCNYCLDQVGVSLITYVCRSVNWCNMESELIVVIMCLSFTVQPVSKELQ